MTLPGEYSLAYGGERIRITLHPRSGTGKKLLIKVLPSQMVQAHVPAGTDLPALERALRQKARWIWQQLEGFRERQADILPRDYTSGECCFYMGRRHMLRVCHQPDGAEGVRLLRGRLEVVTRHPTPVRIGQLLMLWYFQRAEVVFARRMAALLPSTPWVKQAPKLRLLVMQTQWGNCSPGGVVTLNPHLVKASRDCVDYVILHELCHLVEHNHSPAFWQLMDRVMPDWPQHKAQLDNQAETLLR